MLEKIEVNKVYRNKKNKHLYKVEGIGFYTEKPIELTKMVFYRGLAIYPLDDGKNYWVRPFDLFLDKFEEVE
jgi:hypothetical protein